MNFDKMTEFDTRSKIFKKKTGGIFGFRQAFVGGIES